LKPWQLNKKLEDLSGKLDDSIRIETRIDFNCFSERERKLFGRIQKIIDKYAPATPPEDVIEKNSRLWYKGLEIFARRATELFVEVMPASICCDELESWYFKLYFYNFIYDWIESVQQLREMPKERHDVLLCERREMGLLDRVFRIHRTPSDSTEKRTETENNER
jgi:hypothetical protein